MEEKNQENKLAIEILFISLLISGLNTKEALSAQNTICNTDFLELMLTGYVPSLAMVDKDNDDYIWTVYGKFRKGEFPNLGNK